MPAWLSLLCKLVWCELTHVRGYVYKSLVRVRQTAAQTVLMTHVLKLAHVLLWHAMSLSCCTYLRFWGCHMQVLTIATHRPASLITFFKQQQAQSKGSDAASPSQPVHELAGLLVQALPWVLHSLKAHTGNPHFPSSFLRWLVQNCVAAIVSCTEALVGKGLLTLMWRQFDSCYLAPSRHLCRHEQLQGSTQGQGLLVMLADCHLLQSMCHMTMWQMSAVAAQRCHVILDMCCVGTPEVSSDSGTSDGVPALAAVAADLVSCCDQEASKEAAAELAQALLPRQGLYPPVYPPLEQGVLSAPFLPFWLLGFHPS